MLKFLQPDLRNRSRQCEKFDLWKSDNLEEEMTTKEFDAEEDQSEPFTSVSDRDNLYIIHRGKPPNEHSPFGTISTKPLA
jgi:hypothetical protein